MVGQTRVHVDQVEGLGSFMELEVWNLKANFLTFIETVCITCTLIVQEKLAVTNFNN